MIGPFPMAPPHYRPPRLLRNPHLNTIFGARIIRPPEVAYRRERWDTPDGDFIDVDLVDGASTAPRVVLFHGLEGSSRSSYARALMDRVAARGWRGAVAHFRGCSGELNRLPRAYHSGDSDEADWVLRRLHASDAGKERYVVGVSLGGNVLCKWLGERRAGASELVTAAAAVCAPFDLHAAGDALERGFNRIYAENFLFTMKRRALDRLARFPGLFDEARLRAARTLRAFDDVFTAPLHGFRDTDDYWTRSSSRPLLGGITVPTLLLSARDDPFLPEAALPGASEVSSAVVRDFPRFGGHVAFSSGCAIGYAPGRILHFFDHRE
jgi:predicted alpha/beta-fold hydrolase